MIDGELFQAPPVVRTGVQRIHRRTLKETDVAKAVGPITKGCDIFGLTHGSWGLVDLLAHALNATGPVDHLVICTWTVGNADIDLVAGMVERGQVKRLTFVCDHSYPHRQPALCEKARKLWGSENFVVSDAHGKYALLGNDDWNLCISGTMNLNKNIRLETYQVSDCPEMYALLNDFTEHARRVMLPLDAPQKSHRARFAREFGQGDFFDTSPMGRDMARVGMTRGR